MLHVGVGRRNAQNVGSAGAGVVAGLKPVAWYRLGLGITIATGVSRWADQSGNGNHQVQATGTLQPLLQADKSILFDGSDDFLQATFTWNQPATQYMLVQQVTWTGAGNRLTAGTVASSDVFQRVASPTIGMTAGTNLATDANLIVGFYGVVAAVFNGNSSVFQVNNNAPTTGAAGAGNAGGLTIGASNAGASPTNIKIKEAICYAGAHDAATRRTIINYLAGVGNITV